MFRNEPNPLLRPNKISLKPTKKHEFRNKCFIYSSRLDRQNSTLFFKKRLTGRQIIGLRPSYIKIISDPSDANKKSFNLYSGINKIIEYTYKFIFT